LAESWQPVGDATWEFKLRQGVTFHDGTPFNAEVLKFTLERIFDPTFNSLQKTYWVPITAIETPDEYTIHITTETPMGTMPYTMALTMPVLPSVGVDPNAFPATPIGTGPFKFVEWVKDDKVVLEAYDGYWGGAPKVQQVIFRTIPELSTRMSALETGEIDISLEIVPEDVERLQGSGDLTIQSVQTFRTSWLWMNPQREPLGDPRVRQAIRMAVDLDAISQSIIAGVGYRAEAPIAPTVFGFDPDLPPVAYDPEGAKALLAEAGFPDGFDTTVTGLGQTGAYTRFGDVSLVVIDQLAAIGIRAEPITKDAATAEKDLLALNWDMTFAGATAATGDADSGLARLYLSSANRTGWANEEVDRLLMVGRQSTNQDERLAAYKDAQKILWEEGPTLWTYHHIDTVGVRNRVQGFVARPDRLLDVRGVSVTD
jgi:peptide/nickel transport system substrate-binding protein